MTLILADRGDRDNLVLLPPWGSMGKKVDPPGNVAFWHSGQANVLYVDGHAESQSPGDWLTDKEMWGGSRLVLRRAARTLWEAYPALRQVERALAQRKEAEARRLLSTDLSTARKGFAAFVALWKENTGSDRDERLEAWGRQGARLFATLGEKGFEEELNTGQSRRSQAERTRVQSGSWQRHESKRGFLLEHPGHWTQEMMQDGPSTRTYFRAEVPFVSVMVETGRAPQHPTSTKIGWQERDAEMRGRYGSRYRLVRMGTDRLGGVEAGVWVFELERRAEPRLKKRVVGCFHSGESFAIVCAAPAKDFDAWQGVFDRIVQSFRFRW